MCQCVHLPVCKYKEWMNNADEWAKLVLNCRSRWINTFCRFETIFPLELEGRVQPSQLFSFLNAINAKFVEAYAMTPNSIDNLIALATLWTSLLWKTSHFEKKLKEVERLIEDANRETFNKVGLNVLSPRDVALQFVSQFLSILSWKQVADRSCLDRCSWRLSKSYTRILYVV